ncbi:hypothetical protein QSV34_00670 [Porticoccus sp. W117]|uniref:COG4648 family protein n=1 Tax=Porticoccus sp. W117 TaxID=3054777 RepID=UPI0025960648|nr:hypothetical protein [Porticoccus sp. W117]MDM3869856.1 hypothetical protein [Porticoccus sp. W117]
MRRLLTGLLVIATALYPVMVYLWVGDISPRVIGGALLLILLIRFALAGNSASAKPMRKVFPLLCLFALLLMFFNHQQLLLWYPVLVNFLMLLVFAYTLMCPPSLIERLARIREPELPAAAVIYTRKVTLAWCVFFALNGLVAAVTAVWANLEVWTLYNGLIAYLLMGLMFVIELAVRRRVRNNNEHAH